MIEITYGSREPPSLVIRGHAGYSTYGTDIICSAVSALYQNLVNSITEFTGDDISARVEPGDSELIWNGSISDTGRVLLHSCLLGLQEIADVYPDYVSIQIV